MRDPRSAPGVIFALDVALQLLAVEIHLAQIAGRVARGLIAEVRRLGIAALAAGRDRPRAHPVAELDDGHEAVAARAVHLVRPRIRARAEGRQRSPPRRREADREARAGVVEGLDDVAGHALVAV